MSLQFLVFCTKFKAVLEWLKYRYRSHVDIIACIESKMCDYRDNRNIDIEIRQTFHSCKDGGLNAQYSRLMYLFNRISISEHYSRGF